MQIENTQKKWANYMAIMSLIGFGMFFLPWIANIDPAKGGGAMIMVGLLLGLTGLITFFMFRSRAKQMDNILNNRNIISRWKIDPVQWEAFAKIDNEALKKNAWSTWLTIAFFFVLFTAFFWFITEDSEEANFFLMLMGGVFAFISIVAWLATNARVRKRQNETSGEVIIADNCLTLNDEFHIWKGIGNQLEAVNYYQAERMLEFTYSYITRTGRQFQDVRVPVPTAEEAQLQKVLKHFGIKPLDFKPVEESDLSEEHDLTFENKKTVEKDSNDEEGFEVKF